MTRTQTLIAGSFVAALLVAGSVMTGQAVAGPHHWQSGPRTEYVYNNLTPEKQAQFDAIMDDFAKRTASLRDKIEAKRIELRTLGNAATPDSRAIGKASEELVALRNEFAKERQALNERISKEVGIAMNRRGDYRPGCPGYGDCGYDRGYGSHMRRGYRMNGGYGHMNGGYHHYGMMYDARTDQTPDNN